MAGGLQSHFCWVFMKWDTSKTSRKSDSIQPVRVANHNTALALALPNKETRCSPDMICVQSIDGFRKSVQFFSFFFHEMIS